MAEELKEAGGKVRLHVAAPLGPGAAVAVDEGQAHYLLHVMRTKRGDRVSLFVRHHRVGLRPAAVDSDYDESHAGSTTAG